MANQLGEVIESPSNAALTFACFATSGTRSEQMSVAERGLCRHSIPQDNYLIWALIYSWQD